MYQFHAQTVYHVAGLLGVAFYISSYLLLQVGLLRGSGYAYPTLNLIASSLVLLSLIQAFNLSSAIIQITWVFISVFGIARIYLISVRLRFNDEERDLMDDVLSDMPLPLARKFLDAGIWMDAGPGTILTTQGRAVSDLCYISGGDATVIAGTREIAEVRRGFVGEMGILSGDPATATVKVKLPSRVFTITGDMLRKLSKNDSEFRWSLEKHLANSTKQKLIEANFRLANGHSPAPGTE